jgi:uncharacterized membrane protein (UPF0182 family)
MNTTGTVTLRLQTERRDQLLIEGVIANLELFRGASPSQLAAIGSQCWTLLVRKFGAAIEFNARPLGLFAVAIVNRQGKASDRLVTLAEDGPLRLRLGQSARERVTPQVKAHLSVLLGLIFLVKAYGYFLGKYTLLVSPRGVVTGASYTDIHAELPALRLLVFIAIACALLFLVNIRSHGWSLPVIAVGLLGVVSVVLGTAVPAFVQHFSVKPQEQQRESPYIQRNIQGTRTAFGLDKISLQKYPADPSVTPNDVQQNPATVDNIRLWRPLILQENFASLQRIHQYYDFNEVDVDRYTIGGQRRVLMVAGREVHQNGLATNTWQNSHLVYTHGFGAVASQVNTASTEGAPVLTLQDIPPVGEPSLAQPRIYYGERPASIASLPGMQEKTIILDGFSKTYAMTGWRMGYGVMPEWLVDAVNKLMVNSNSCTAMAWA